MNQAVIGPSFVCSRAYTVLELPLPGSLDTTLRELVLWPIDFIAGLLFGGSPRDGVSLVDTTLVLGLARAALEL